MGVWWREKGDHSGWVGVSGEQFGHSVWSTTINTVTSPSNLDLLTYQICCCKYKVGQKNQTYGYSFLPLLILPPPPPHPAWTARAQAEELELSVYLKVVSQSHWLITMWMFTEISTVKIFTYFSVFHIKLVSKNRCLLQIKTYLFSENLICSNCAPRIFLYVFCCHLFWRCCSNINMFALYKLPLSSQMFHKIGHFNHSPPV